MVRNHYEVRGETQVRAHCLFSWIERDGARRVHLTGSHCDVCVERLQRLGAEQGIVIVIVPEERFPDAESGAVEFPAFERAELDRKEAAVRAGGTKTGSRSGR